MTCTYDELLHFKRSAATSVAQSKTSCNILYCDDGLVQVDGDNFDIDISSPNGKLSTHSLALLVTQPDTNNVEIDIDTIRRLRKPDIVRYTGLKKCEMRAELSLRTVLPLYFLASKMISVNRAY